MGSLAEYTEISEINSYIYAPTEFRSGCNDPVMIICAFLSLYIRGVWRRMPVWKGAGGCAHTARAVKLECWLDNLV